MKKNIILALAWFCLAFAVIAFFTNELRRFNRLGYKDFMRFGIVNGKFNPHTSVLKEMQFDINEINSIKASLINEDIKFIPSNDDKILVKIIGIEENKELPEIKKENEALLITASKNEKKGFFFGWNYSHRIEISIPSAELYIAANAGNGRAENTISAFIDSTSSDIRICDITLKNLHFKSVSGDVIFRNSKIENQFEFNTKSGDIKGEAFIYGFTGSSVSGDFKLRFLSEPKNDSTFNSTSGDFSIYLPKDITGFSCDFNSSSGDYKNSFTGTSAEKKIYDVYKTDSPRLFIKTVSGDCRIRS